MKIEFRAEAHSDVQAVVDQLAPKILSYKVSFLGVGDVRCEMEIDASEKVFRDALASIPDSHVIARSLKVVEFRMRMEKLKRA